MRLSLLAGFILSGCAALTGPDYYKNTSTYEICRQLMTLPSMNVNHGARTAELSRRGENCGAPSDLAAAQRQADQQLMQNLRPVQPQQPAYQQGTHTYFFNGKYVTCTTTGTMTNCF